MKASEPPLSATCLTSAGVGAMAVIRMEGIDAIAKLHLFFESTRGVQPDASDSGRLFYGRFVDPHHERETIDDGIVAICSSEGGRQTIDLSLHGGLRIVERMLDMLHHSGVAVVDRAARGPFTHVKTRRAVRFVARQLELLPVELERIACVCASDEARGRAQLRALVERSHAAVRLVEGATVVFTGPPNVGKSTLINRLFSSADSLVSPEAGTTRDWVAVEVAVDGVPLRVIDTAGVRTTGDPLEREAIERGLELLRKADVQVLVGDTSVTVPEDFLGEIRPALILDRCIIVRTKSDLPSVCGECTFVDFGVPTVVTSAVTGRGLQELTANLSENLSLEALECPQPMLFSRRWVEESADLLSDRSVLSFPDAVRAMARRFFEDAGGSRCV